MATAAVVLVAAFMAGRQLGGAIGKAKTIKKRADVEARNMELRAQVAETNAAIESRDRFRKVRAMLGQQRALAAGGQRTISNALTENLLSDASFADVSNVLEGDIRADALRVAAYNTRSFAQDAAKKIIVSGIIQSGSTLATGAAGVAGTPILMQGAQSVGTQEQQVQTNFGASGQL